MIVWAWVICGGVAFWLLQRLWRQEFDLEVSDVAVFGLVSVAGPIAILIAGILWGLAALDDWDRVVLPKR